MPPRLVVDFPELRSTLPAVTAVGKGPVDRIRVAVNRVNPLVTRAVIDLKYPAAHRVESAENGVVIVFDDAPAPAEAAAPAAVSPADPPVPVVVRSDAAPRPRMPETATEPRPVARAEAAKPAPVTEPKVEAPAAPAAPPQPVPVVVPAVVAAAPKPAAAEPAPKPARGAAADAASALEARGARRGRRTAVHRAPHHVRLLPGRAAVRAAHVLRDQRPEHRHRSGRPVRHRRRVAARGALGPGPRSDPPFAPARVRPRAERRADRAAEVARRRRGRTPEAGRSPGDERPAEGVHEDPELRAGGRRGEAPEGHPRAVEPRERAGRRSHQHAHHQRPARSHRREREPDRHPRPVGAAGRNRSEDRPDRHRHGAGAGRAVGPERPHGHGAGQHRAGRVPRAERRERAHHQHAGQPDGPGAVDAPVGGEPAGRRARPRRWASRWGR